MHFWAARKPENEAKLQCLHPYSVDTSLPYLQFVFDYSMFNLIWVYAKK